MTQHYANVKAPMRSKNLASDLIANSYDGLRSVVLANSDATKFMQTIPSESAQLVVTSPPYNIGKAYEKRVPFNVYLDSMRSVIAEAVRILRPGGSLCWQVGNYVSKGRPTNLAFEYHGIFKSYEESELYFRNAIIWHFEHGLHSSRRFSGRYETVLWYAKGDDYVFNLDAIRVPQKYPGKRYHKGPKKDQLSGNPLGKNPGDVWTDIPNVKWNHVEKTSHPCQFPVGLVERLILALTNENDLVVDPFMGVGSTAVAAVRTGRRSAGSELKPEYVDIARQRILLAMRDQLPVRTNKPTYEPDPRSNVAMLPDGFLKSRNLIRSST